MKKIGDISLKNSSFKKNFIWNLLGTGLNAFNSLFFLIIVTRINGLEKAGVYTIAFSTSCILYAVGLYSGRIYQVTEQNKKISDRDFIFSRICTDIIMIILVSIFCFYKKYDGSKTFVFFMLTIYKALEAFSDVLYGILQKNDELDIVGKSLFIKSFLSILIFLLVDIISKNMYLSIVSIVVVYILILIIYDYKKVKNKIDYSKKVNKKNIKLILKSGFFTFAISFLGMYVLNAPKYAIDIYLAEEIQTIFGIIVMPATVVGLVAQFLIHPFLNKILTLYENLNIKELRKLILKLQLLVIAFGIIAIIIGYFIGTQVLGLIYGLDLSMYKISLAIIIFSATLYTIGTIYSSVLTTMRSTFSQFIIYVIVSINALIISNILTKNINIKGAIISYFIIMTLQACCYTIFTNIKLNSIANKNAYIGRRKKWKIKKLQYLCQHIMEKSI